MVVLSLGLYRFPNYHIYIKLSKMQTNPQQAGQWLLGNWAWATRWHRANPEGAGYVHYLYCGDGFPVRCISKLTVYFQHG